MNIRTYIVTAVLLASAAKAPAVTFTLDLSTSGPVSTSVITSSPTGISCGNGYAVCSSTFTEGSTVTLTNVVGSTVVFAGWGGPAGCSNNSSTCRVLMSANKNLTAQYNPVLSVSLAGDGAGTVYSSSSSINCNSANGCANGGSVTHSYYPGTVVVLRSSANVNSAFVAWTGSGCGFVSTCTVTMDSYKTVVATFTATGPIPIMVTKSGTGTGFITSSPAGINCGDTCLAYFNFNSTVTFTATPMSGYSFTGWSNAGCASTGTCVVIATTAAQGLGGAYSPSAAFY